MKIDVDKIGALIGPGGKNVKALCEQYSVKIDTADDGTVTIFGKNAADAENAQKAVHGIVDDPEIGIVYQGVVRRVMDFGAFVEILPGKEGLVHISKLSRDRIASVGDILQEGQEIPVKLMEIDKMGRLNLSYIDAIDPDGAPAYESHHDSRPPRSGGYDRPPRRDGYNGDRGGYGGDRGGRGGDRGGRGGDRPRYR